MDRKEEDVDVDIGTSEELPLQESAPGDPGAFVF
tara:strand:- start:366 stop:467 length:102 start_codon:yes stop_codon:yes gene_type:complete